MNTMDCADIKALLSGLIDDEIDAETRHLAERHLSECKSCRALINEAEDLDRLMAIEAEDTFGSLPPGFEDAVFETIRTPAPVMKPYALRVSTWVGWLAAAASLALALTIWVNDRRSDFPDATVAILPEDTQAPLILEEDTPRPTVQMASHTVPVFGSELDLSGDVSRYALPETDTGLMPVISGDGSPANDPVEIVREKSRELSALSDRPTLTLDEAQTLYAASILLEMIAEADTDSFADVEMARQILEYDELLPRLTKVRSRLEPEDRPALVAAESLFTWILRGPIDLADVAQLREIVVNLNLHDDFASLSDRGPRGGSA